MEIERKFIIERLPENIDTYPFLKIEQAYLCVNPVVRVRREDDNYILTYKGEGMMAREEYNLPLTPEAYRSLIKKCDGVIIKKRRHMIPYGKYTIELDVFDAPFAPLIMAEVEFETIEEAKEFTAPDWFITEVTEDKRYHNSNMSAGEIPPAL